MDKISAVVTTVSGEEKYLASCLTSIKDFVDETVVVDMSSGNDIAKIARKMKAKIFKHDFINYVEPVRNFGIRKANGNWVLILDPDEELPKSLINRLKEIVANNEADYVRIPRRNIIFGKVMRHSRWWPDYNIRFFKKGKVSWDEIIHKVPMTEGKGIDLNSNDEFAIIHNHYQTIEQFIERMNRYTSIQAELKAREYKFRWQDLLTKPSAEFISRFFAAEGYRDGIHGLALSSLQSFYELIVYLKVWQIQKFKDESLPVTSVVKVLNNVKKELNYWQNDVQVKEKGGILPRIRRKLKI